MYRKLSFEGIWATSFLYNEYTTQRKMNITEFRAEVITAILERNHAEDQGEAATSRRVNAHPKPKNYLIINKKEGKKVQNAVRNMEEKERKSAVKY